MKKQDAGKKICNILIDKKRYLIFLAFLLLILNIFLCFAAIFLAVWVNVWYVWAIDMAMVLFCLVRSLITFYVYFKQYGYALHAHGIVLNSLIYDNTIIEYSSIKNIKFKKGFLEKILSPACFKMTLVLNDNFQTKLNIHFVKENPKVLMEKIAVLSNTKFQDKNKNH